jgi:hypothetical protein
VNFLKRKRENHMIYRVKEPFSYTDDRGVPRVMRVGDLVTVGHDAYREKWAHLYEPVAEAAERVAAPGTETATAAPGEKRSLPEPPPKTVEDDLDALRKEAEDAGVAVDGRWKADRLRQEIAAAKPKGKA